MYLGPVTCTTGSTMDAIFSNAGVTLQVNMHRKKLKRQNSMKFDSLVFMAYVFGSIFISLGTLMRYSLSAAEPGKIVRLINAIKVVSLREKTPDAFGLLIQYMGVIWLLLGTAYGIIFRQFVIKGILDDCLTFLVLISPAILLIGMVKLLQKYYWQSQK